MRYIETRHRWSTIHRCYCEEIIFIVPRPNPHIVTIVEVCIDLRNAFKKTGDFLRNSESFRQRQSDDVVKLLPDEDNRRYRLELATILTEEISDLQGNHFCSSISNCGWSYLKILYRPVQAQNSRNRPLWMRIHRLALRLSPRFMKSNL